MMSIWCEYTLMCAHHLPRLPESHPCHRLHGHNYTVRVHVRGVWDKALEWVVDYAMVNMYWQKLVHDQLDHTLLNDTIENPTCENLAVWIHEQLSISAMCGEVWRIEIQEEDKAGVVYEPSGDTDG